MIAGSNLDFVVEQVQLKEKLIKFLIRKELLLEVEKNCVYFVNKPNKKRFEPFSVNLTLRFRDFSESEEDGVIKHLVVDEPRHFEVLLREVVYCHIEPFLAQSDFNIQPDQIFAVVRFYDLPLLSKFKFSFQHVHLNCSLSYLRCIIYKILDSTLYSQLSLWKCPNCQVEIIHTNHDINQAVRCKRCLIDCKENISERSTSEVSSVQVFDPESLKTQNIEQAVRTNALVLKLCEDLCQIKLKLGQEYIVIGVFDPLKKIYKVWSIEEASLD